MILRLAFRNLVRNPRRTAAILLTVALGASSLVIFSGFNNGVMNQYRENTLHSRYGNGQINVKGYREKVFEKPWEHWMENPVELEKKLLATSGVEYIFPRVDFFSLLTNGKITVAGRGQGVDGEAESKFFTTLNVEEGVTLANQADGILLGLGLARALDVKPGDHVTALVNTIHGTMNGADFTVTGVFHTGSKDFDDVMFRIPLKQAQTLLDTDRIETIALGLDSVSSWPKVERLITSEFPNFEATPFEVLDEVYYQHSVNWLNSQFGIIQTIILSIVVLGIFNTVSTSVFERKQEIGNLRANGDSSFEVLTLLLSEGAVLGIVGGVLGVLIAYGVTDTLLRDGILMAPAPGITRQFHVWIELERLMALKALVMGFLACCLGTGLAGLKVSRMPIGEALRST